MLSLYHNINTNQPKVYIIKDADGKDDIKNNVKDIVIDIKNNIKDYIIKDITQR